MPARNVYGKKSRRPEKFNASTSFWSSPDKPKSPTKITAIKNIDEPLQTLTDAIASIRLCNDSADTDHYDHRIRKALGSRDANAVVYPKHLKTTWADDSNKDVRRSPRLKSNRQEPGSVCRNVEQSPTRASNRSPSLQSDRPVEPAPQVEGDSEPRKNDIVSIAEEAEQRHGNKSDCPATATQRLLSLVSDSTKRAEPITFAAWTADLEDEFTISKIAEASFAQVYLLQRKEVTGNPREDQSILKVISLHPESTEADLPDTRPPKVKETSSDISKVVSELKLLDRMTEIPGFTNLREVSVLKGQPSAPLITAWKQWNKTRKKDEKSYFPDPSRKANYGESQLWAVIEMDHAGLDLEHPETKIESVESLWDVFWGVAITLAKGEEDVKFEHRDLHLGNVCVSQRSPQQRHHKARQKLGTSGLETTIIDYTLSRAEITDKCGTNEILYVDLEKEGIFEGDASLNYQYELYRYMRSAVFSNTPLPTKQDDTVSTSWQESHLQTNVLWLYFLLHELWPKVSDDMTDEPRPSRTKGSSDELRTNLGVCLAELMELLRLEHWSTNGLRSAKDLVLLALDRGWLDPEDVSGGVIEEVKDVTEILSALNMQEGRAVGETTVPDPEDDRSPKPRRGRRRKD